MVSADGARIIGTLASQHRDALAALYAPRAAFFDLALYLLISGIRRTNTTSSIMTATDPDQARGQDAGNRKITQADDTAAAWTGVVARVRCVSGELLTIASLNTRGIPLTGSQLAARYAVIGAGFDAGDANVVCGQEVFTYWHLRLLVRRMRSFPGR